MKLYRFLPLVLLVLGWNSCTSDIPQQECPDTPAGTTELKIGSVSFGEETRSMANRMDSFRKGDIIGLLIYDQAGNPFSEKSLNIPAVFDGEKWIIEADPIIYNPSNPPVIAAYYPFSTNFNKNAENGSIVLEPEGNTVYTADTLHTLFSSPNRNGELNLQFYHNTAALEFYVRNAEDRPVNLIELRISGSAYEYYNESTGEWATMPVSAIYGVTGFKDINTNTSNFLYRMTESWAPNYSPVSIGMGQIVLEPGNGLDYGYIYLNGLKDNGTSIRNCTFSIQLYTDKKAYSVPNIPITWESGKRYVYTLAILPGDEIKLSVAPNSDIVSWSEETEMNVSTN